MTKRTFCGILIFNSLLFSEGVILSGYTAPAPVSVAAGRMATFYVQIPRGVSADLIGVTLQQGSIDTNQDYVQAHEEIANHLTTIILRGLNVGSAH